MAFTNHYENLILLPFLDQEVEPKAKIKNMELSSKFHERP